MLLLLGIGKKEKKKPQPNCKIDLKLSLLLSSEPGSHKTSAGHYNHLYFCFKKVSDCNRIGNRIGISQSDITH